ncbi:hypothetical protein TUMEXPCC7403_18110 [Tumidithrix helvetica PCC 7403]
MVLLASIILLQAVFGVNVIVKLVLVLPLVVRSGMLFEIDKREL